MLEDFEDIEPANNPQEMRAELHKLRYNNYLVRSIMDIADHAGLSGEDRYVMLSYHAMKMVLELQRNHLRQFNSSPYPNPVFIKEPPK